MLIDKNASKNMAWVQRFHYIGRLKVYPAFQTAYSLCKTPFPSLLRRPELGLRSFGCRAGGRYQSRSNQMYDFIENSLFSKRCDSNSKK